MKTIDLNCDMGEFPEAISDGTQEALLPFFTSVNIACGGHAGDAQTMRTTIEQAMRFGVAIGAHPGYADRPNFGRLELDLSADAVAESVCEQVWCLAEIAAGLGARLAHVKPHGALYNQAVHSQYLTVAIAKGVARWCAATPKNDRSGGSVAMKNHNGGGGDTPPKFDVVMVGLAGSPMLDVFREAGFPSAAEAFADRRYEANGTLRHRKFEDALIRDPAQAAAQAVSIAQRGTVIASNGVEVPVAAQTICLHSDTPGSVKIAAAVAHALRESGVTVSPLEM
ncbi:MAG TPA: 5-oxoprolinase subunit PxpA [Candidatus Acidoferrum sp.]